MFFCRCCGLGPAKKEGKKEEEVEKKKKREGERKKKKKSNSEDAFSFEFPLARTSSLSALRHLNQAAEAYLVTSPSREIAAVAPARADTASLLMVASTSAAEAIATK